MFTVGTYNIQYGHGADGRLDIARTVETIRDIDIIGLQEVDVGWDRSENLDMPTVLQSLLPNHYAAWGPTINLIKQSGKTFAGPTSPRRQFGNLILSKLPILSTRNHLLPKYGAVSVLDMQHGVVEATILLPSGAVRVYNTFLCHISDEHRCREVKAILDIIDRAPFEGPPLSGTHERDKTWSSEVAAAPVPLDAFLVGDMNLTTTDRSYSLLVGDRNEKRGHVARLGRFVDAWEAAPERRGIVGDATSEGATRYDGFPPELSRGRRIDYCLVPSSYADRIVRATVDTSSTASDHLPLVVEID